MESRCTKRLPSAAERSSFEKVVIGITIIVRDSFRPHHTNPGSTTTRILSHGQHSAFRRLWWLSKAIMRVRFLWQQVMMSIHSPRQLLRISILTCRYLYVGNNHSGLAQYDILRVSCHCCLCQSIESFRIQLIIEEQGMNFTATQC